MFPLTLKCSYSSNAFLCAPSLCFCIYSVRPWGRTCIVFINAKQKSIHCFKGPFNIASSESTYLEVKPSSFHIFCCFGFLFNCYFVLFRCTAQHVVSFFPDQGSNLCCLQRKFRVLTTGPLPQPGKFLDSSSLNI